MSKQREYPSNRKHTYKLRQFKVKASGSTAYQISVPQAVAEQFSESEKFECVTTSDGFAFIRKDEIDTEGTA